MRSAVEKWQPGREHIVPAGEGEFKFKHFVTGYDPAWPETFIDACSETTEEAAAAGTTTTGAAAQHLQPRL
jgi:hypothetical protein